MKIEITNHKEGTKRIVDCQRVETIGKENGRTYFVVIDKFGKPSHRMATPTHTYKVLEQLETVVYCGEEMYVCPQCGKYVPMDMNYCGYCGKYLNKNN